MQPSIGQAYRNGPEESEETDSDLPTIEKGIIIIIGVCFPCKQCLCCIHRHGPVNIMTNFYLFFCSDCGIYCIDGQNIGDVGG